MKKINLKLNLKFLKTFNSKLLSWDLKKLAKMFVIYGLIIGAMGSYMGYTRLYMNHERTFWSAIENSMATRSITRTIESGGTGNRTVKTTRYSLGPQISAESKVTFDQKSATVNTSVATESLVMMDAQYSRYLAFSTNEEKDDGSKPSLDDLIGKWESNVVDDANKDDARLSYIGDMVSLVIFANHDTELRQELINELKSNNVYTISKKRVKADNINGEDVDVYAVGISLRDYARVLQRSFVESGFGSFPPLEPTNYREGSILNASIAISKRTGNIIGVSYGDRQEEYSGYGVLNEVQVPETVFSSGELEASVSKELEDLQQ